MRRALPLLLLSVTCGGEKLSAPEAMGPAVSTGLAQVAAIEAPDGAAALAAPINVTAPSATTGESSRPRLELSLRSTPAGAAASVDGKLVGTTPVRLEIQDDGRAHLFSFVLAGHEPWKLKFAPVKDGVIHATMRPSAGDAGVR